MKKLLLALLLCGCGGEVIDIPTNSIIFSAPSIPSEVNIPTNLYWGNIDTDGDGNPENYITPIKSQPCSDCFLYSTTGLLEIQFQIDHKSSSTLDLSEQSIHNCLRIKCDDAGSEPWMLNHIKNYGIMEEAYVPTGLWNTCPNCSGELFTGIGKLPVRNIPFFTFKDYKKIVSPEMNYKSRKGLMVKALQSGPLVMDISSWNGWAYDDNGLLYCVKENPTGHSVIVVGYENLGEIFLIKNSHGGTKILKMIFNNGNICGFAHNVYQIVPGSTYISYGLGEKICSLTTDIDRDGIPDIHDNCPFVENPNQENADGDILGDACDECPNDFNIFTGYYCAPKLPVMEIEKLERNKLNVFLL